MPCPEPFHVPTLLIIYNAFFLSLTQMLVFRSLYVMLSILLSMLVCAAGSLFCACLIRVQVYAPYVLARSRHELFSYLIKQITMLLLTISRCLAYAVQPAMILRCISLPCIGCCPKYTLHWTFFSCIWVLSTTINFVFAMFIVRPIGLHS